MTTYTQHNHGAITWADLSSTDAQASKEFLASLFGWDYRDDPAGENGIYTMFSLKGKDVAALNQMSPEQQAQGVPSYWTSYITVRDLDAAAAKVLQNGGTLLAPPFDVMDAGRMAVVMDPTGASFALWEAKAHIGAKVLNEPNTLSWFELATKDLEKAKAFYAAVLGWNYVVDESPGTPYVMAQTKEVNRAGLMQMDEEWGEMASHWMVYFAVTDAKATAEKAVELGGTVGVEPTKIPNVGTFAVIQDPAGSYFSVMAFVTG